MNTMPFRFTVLIAIALPGIFPLSIFGQTGDPTYSVETVTALRTINTSSFGTSIPAALTAGYYAGGDNGGNRFFWSGSSTASDNGGTIITPAASPTQGRWLAVRSSVVNVRTFGAKGDGITDDTAAIQGAIMATPRGEIIFDRGTYILANVINCASLNGISFRGAGKGLTILKSTIPSGTPRMGDATMLKFSNCTNFSVRGITFDNNSILTTQSVTEMVLAANSVNFIFADCEFLNFKRFALAVQSSQRFWITDNYFYAPVIAGGLSSYQTGSIRLYDNTSPCGPGWILHNEIIGAGVGYGGLDIVYAYNRITNFQYGSGIVVGSTSPTTVNRVTIIGNTITGGGPGKDNDGFYPKGIECYCAYARIIGNICYNNAGGGIVFGGLYSLVSSNLCYSNGTSANPAYGIAGSYVSGSADPSNSSITNNICRSPGPTFQAYGYQDIGAAVASVSLHFSGNDFSGNKTADFSKSSTSRYYTWVSNTYQVNTSWTPGTIAAGASLTLGVTVPNATVGDTVGAAFSAIPNSAITIGANVSSPNAVTAVITNNNSSAITLGAGTLYLTVSAKAPF